MNDVRPLDNTSVSGSNLSSNTLPKYLMYRLKNSFEFVYSSRKANHFFRGIAWHDDHTPRAHGVWFFYHYSTAGRVQQGAVLSLRYNLSG